MCSIFCPVTSAILSFSVLSRSFLLMYLVKPLNFARFWLCSCMYLPKSSYGNPPLATCLAIALAPSKWIIGNLNLSPSSFWIKIALIFLDLAPTCSSSTAFECLIITFAVCNGWYDVLLVPHIRLLSAILFCARYL